MQLQEVLRLASVLQQQLQGSSLFPALQQQLQLAVQQAQQQLLADQIALKPDVSLGTSFAAAAANAGDSTPVGPNAASISVLQRQLQPEGTQQTRQWELPPWHGGAECAHAADCSRRLIRYGSSTQV
jgi:hypothetical protein